MPRPGKFAIISVFGLVVASLPVVGAFHGHEGEPSDLLGCGGCALFEVTVRVIEVESSEVAFERSERVLAQGLRHFAIASIGFNDDEGREGTIRVDDLRVMRSDGSQAAWDFSTAPLLHRGATGQDHKAVRYDAAAQALDAVGNSSYACAPGYETIEVATEGATVRSMSVEFQKVTPHRGGSDYWDIHLGLVPDATRPAIHTGPPYNPCPRGEPQGFVQELVGLRIAGDNAGWRHALDGVYNGTADGRVFADHRLGTRYRLEVDVVPAPLVQGANLHAWGDAWEVPALAGGQPGRVAYAVVHNGGTQPTAAFDVLFSPHPDRPCPDWEYGDDPSCSIVRYRGLAPGEVGIVRSDPMEGSDGQNHLVVLDAGDEVAEVDEADNRYVNRLYATPSDPAVSGVGHDVWWRSLYGGDRVNLSARVANFAYESTGSFRVVLALDGVAVAEQTYDPLGDRGSLVVDGPAWVATLGPHALTATLTPLDPSRDAVPANNVMTYLFAVLDAQKPGDLAPRVGLVFGFFPDENLASIVPPGAPGTAWIVTASVCNAGGGPVRSGRVVVTAEASGVAGVGSTGDLVGSFETGFLAPGACVADVFVWQPLVAVGSFDIVARATSTDDLVDEVVLDNNEARERVAAPVDAGFGVLL